MGTLYPDKAGKWPSDKIVAKSDKKRKRSTVYAIVASSPPHTIEVNAFNTLEKALAFTDICKNNYSCGVGIKIKGTNLWYDWMLKDFIKSDVFIKFNCDSKQELLKHVDDVLFRAKKEAVDHPQHYGGTDNPYETIKVLEARLTRDEFIGALKFQVYKYNDRANYKGNAAEDYAKGAWYQNYLAEYVKRTMPTT